MAETPVTETPRERTRRREAERQAQRAAEHATWLAGHPDRQPLFDLNLASEVFVAADGFPAVAVHSNQEAANILLASDWLAAHDAEVRAEAWDEGYQACRTRPSIDGYRINRTNPYRTEAPHV